MPPFGGNRRESGEAGITEDGQAEGSAAAHHVSDASEEGTTQGPTNKKGRITECAFFTHLLVGAGQDQQLRHERGRDQRVNVHVQPVEHPSQPSRQAGLLLL